MNYANENIVVLGTDALKILPLKYVKNYLRIDNNCDDEFLMNCIATAINYAEAITNKVFGTKTYSLSFTTKKAITKIDKSPLIINKINKISVNTIQLNEEDYNIKNGIVILKKNLIGNVQIIFNAGMPLGELPVDIRQAMLFHIASIYQNKNGSCIVPPATQEIYNLYRKIHI